MGDEVSVAGDPSPPDGAGLRDPPGDPLGDPLADPLGDADGDGDGDGEGGSSESRGIVRGRSITTPTMSTDP